MSTKSEFLQIRVSPAQKETLRRRAGAAGLDLSSYVLARTLPVARAQFEDLVWRLGAGDEGQRFVIAELNDLLTRLSATEFNEAVEHANVSDLSPMLANYLAAMVELGASMKRVSPPAWTRVVAPLEEPYFGAPLKSLRLHLLRAAPVPFRRRNIFIDASLGDRV